MIKDKILGIAAAIGGLFAAIFYVLFQQKKAENEKISEAYENTKKDVEEQRRIIDTERSALEEMNKRKKENEEQKQNAHGGNHLSNFDSGINILSK